MNIKKEMKKFKIKIFAIVIAVTVLLAMTMPSCTSKKYVTDGTYNASIKNYPEGLDEAELLFDDIHSFEHYDNNYSDNSK